MITLFWTIAFCLGWRTVTDEGMLLYFIRKPFDKSFDELQVLKDKIELAGKFEKTLVGKLKWKLLRHKLIVTIGKPFVLCITCFASVWGISVFVALNGLNESLIVPLILNSFSAAFIQTFIWNLYEKYA
jgi:hypothetical protein